MTHNRLLALSMAGLIFAALPAAAKPAPPKATVQTATIENSGSTNTLGYMLRITPEGVVVYRIGAAISPNTHLNIWKIGPRAQAKKLFSDLEGAMPLSALPARHGMRSVSFGTTTTITYKGQTSPDLTFASDPRAVALKADIAAITKTLRLGNLPRRPIVLHLNQPNTH